MKMRLALVVLLGLPAVAGCGSSNKCPPAAPGVPPNPAAVEASPAPAATPTPAPTPPPATQNDAILRVEVAKDGTISIEGTRLTDPRDLTARARSSARVRPELQVIIIGERDVPYASVINAMDLVKQAGISRISLEVGKAPAPPATAQPVASVPTLAPGEAWKCHFAGHVDHLGDKTAFIAIHVGPDGKAQTVDVLEDPGQGMGETAQICAMKHKFLPARDAAGNPTVGVMKLRVSFQH